MANALAIKIRTSKKYPTPTAKNLAHNSAINKASYWLNDGANIIQSETFENHRTLNENWNNWIKENEFKYSKSHTKKMRVDAVRIEEGIIVIGSDVEMSEENIIQVTKDFIAKFEKDNKTKVRHWSYHDHEGHIKNGEEVINRHIHFLFDNVDDNGQMIRRNWSKNYFHKLQDDIFTIGSKYADIERGQKSEYETVIIEDREVKINTKQGQHHRVFRKEKEQVAIKEKVVKKANEYINKKTVPLAKVKDLDKEIEKLRQDLIASKSAEKDHYTQLAELKKDLKIRVKSKDLTIQELQKEIEELKELIYHPEYKTKNNKRAKYRTIANHFETLSNEQKKEIEQLKTENKLLKDENSNLNDYISKIQAKNEELISRLEQFEKELEIALNKQKSYFGLNEDLKKQIKSLESEKLTLENELLTINLENNSNYISIPEVDEPEEEEYQNYLHP